MCSYIFLYSLPPEEIIKSAHEFRKSFLLLKLSPVPPNLFKLETIIFSTKYLLRAFFSNWSPLTRGNFNFPICCLVQNAPIKGR